jgi:hypothetical protein
MEVKQKITTGNYEIIASGQFLAFRESSIELGEGDDKIKLNFIFKEGDSEEKKVEGTTVSNKEVTLTFLGFDDSNLGRGNKTPFSIGKFMGKELLMSYRVSLLDDKTLRTFNYTFYAA